MRDADCLWQRSSAWRLLFYSTVVVTALCILAAPWRLQSAQPTPGQYTATPTASTPAQAQAQAPAFAARAQSLARQSPRDAGFDRAVTVGGETFASDVEMHVIGVYGPAMSGSQATDWVQACKPVMGTALMIDCRRRFEAGRPESRTITVEVERSAAPLVLVLMAYEAVNWKVVVRPGIDLRKVIVSGYSGPDIQGVPNGVPVDVYSYEASPCGNCSRQSGTFWAYDVSKPEYTSAMTRLKAITGLTPTSFQSGYKGSRFTIQRWLGNRQVAPGPASADASVGKVFSNFIDLGGKTLPLPEGVWEVLGTDDVSAPRGQDRLLILARSEKGLLQELMVTHLQTANDGNGFPAYNACNGPADYAARVEQNQPGGLQQCYWVNHSEDPWQQPIYRVAANRLKERGIAVPDSAVVSGFHKATKDFGLTTQYYSFFEAGVNTGSADWPRSPWNPARIKAYDAIQKFVKGRVDWASGWFMLMNAMR